MNSIVLTLQSCFLESLCDATDAFLVLSLLFKSFQFFKLCPHDFDEKFSSQVHAAAATLVQFLNFLHRYSYKMLTVIKMVNSRFLKKMREMFFVQLSVEKCLIFDQWFLFLLYVAGVKVHIF